MKNILLTWDAYNNGFVVTAKVIELLLVENNINIDEIIYLQNQNLSEENLSEIDVFFGKKSYNEVSKNIKDNYKERIRGCYNIRESILLETKKLPKFKNKFIPIKSVTDYQSIYNNLIEFIKKEFYDKNINLHINVSPGTPQMHVVWLMLNSAGFLPVNATLWSSQWVKSKEKTILTKINFKPKVFLSEILKSKYHKTNLPIINTNETKSKPRREAEERIKLFSHIPNAPILLLGERGTGKSTYVRTLIKETQNQELPYEELACGIFSEELMRSELFGYKEGSFTGANKDKSGILSKFKSGGTLFLDEIHDLTKPLQRQLMQVLQTGEYYPIGSDKPDKAFFRLIVASNLSYESLYKQLDSDFIDRIARFIIKIPPLRECKEDLEIYWEKVWLEVSNFENAPSLIWSKSLHNFLLENELFGNFRDLQKIASYIIAFYYDTHNTEKAISKGINEFNKWSEINIDRNNTYFKINSTYSEIIAYFNKDLAEWAIKQYGNKKEASKILKRSESMLGKDIRMERIN